MPRPPTNRRRSFSAPTIDDVAQAAGVSTATVSRALNSPDQVVPETRNKVMQTVAKLGYAPNFGARAMAAKRTNTIGAIIPTMENAIFARGLQAFQEELGRNQFTLLVASSSYQTKLEDEQIRTLLARGADALLLIGFARSQTAYQMLHARQIPAVVAWSYREDAPVPSVGFDNKSAMRELTDAVFEHGHRRIAIISAPTTDNDRAADRVEAVLQAARAGGLERADIPIIETPYSIDNGARAATDLLHRVKRPTAIICGNDVLAVGALKAAKSFGIKVPQELSITGFDDIELAQIADPPLTTVHVPHREMGRLGAKLLLELLDGQGALPGRELKTRIVFRESLGPAPK
ncbi:MAG: LacI family DNA-binding transcriptional regulator [Pseudomonadota bacterium]